MNWVDYLQADCEVLSDRLRRRIVPKSQRAVARRLLSRIFALQSLERSSEEDSELRALSRQIETLAYPIQSDWYPLTLLQASAMNPVRMRFAVSHSRVRQLHDRYLGRIERLEAVVSWFWQRCAPEDEVARDLSIHEQALDKFAGEDLEYVWGRRKRSEY